MVYGLFRPLSQRWRFVTGDLDLDTMQGYVSESQWEVDTTVGVADYSVPIKKVQPAYIECVQLKNGIDFWVNDSGLIYDFHPSLHVDYSDLGWQGHGAQTLHGTIIAARTDGEGATIGLTDEDIKYLDFGADSGMTMDKDSTPVFYTYGEYEGWQEDLTTTQQVFKML
jgi:hypothetical protein